MQGGGFHPPLAYFVLTWAGSHPYQSYDRILRDSAIFGLGSAIKISGPIIKVPVCLIMVNELRPSLAFLLFQLLVFS